MIHNEGNLELTTDARIAGGSFRLPSGHLYHGTWYEALAEDNEGRVYRLYWTSWDDVEDESDACDWDNPDYIIPE